LTFLGQFTLLKISLESSLVILTGRNQQSF